MFWFRDSQKLCFLQHQLKSQKQLRPRKFTFSFLAIEGEFMQQSVLRPL